jgi:hypothetical protein
MTSREWTLFDCVEAVVAAWPVVLGVPAAVAGATLYAYMTFTPLYVASVSIAAPYRPIPAIIDVVLEASPSIEVTMSERGAIDAISVGPTPEASMARLNELLVPLRAAANAAADKARITAGSNDEAAIEADYVEQWAAHVATTNPKWQQSYSPLQASAGAFFAALVFMVFAALFRRAWVEEKAGQVA